MLTVTALHKAFRGKSKSQEVLAVDGIDLDVQPGEFVTLLGPSGCGKTTTLRCIAGLQRADSGEVCLGDRVVYSSAESIFVPPSRRGIGMVFQSYAIWPHMNVFDNVAFPLRVSKRKVSRKQIGERVERVLEVVGLGHLTARYATQMSGGQQQRLALARALVIEPELLLLDEPLSNLDAKLRESLRFELKRLQREQGITTLYVTHDQSEALSLSNRVAVMSAGRIVQMGAPFDIYLKPQTEFVADFVGTTNFLRGSVLSAHGQGSGVVSTGIGEVHVSDVQDLEPGRSCAVSVRPEHVSLRRLSRGEDRDLGPNWFDAAVDTRLFMGEVMDYQLRVGAADTLRARGSTMARVSTGEDVCIHLPPEHCVAIGVDD